MDTWTTKCKLISFLSLSLIAIAWRLFPSYLNVFVFAKNKVKQKEQKNRQDNQRQDTYLILSNRPFSKRNETMEVCAETISISIKRVKPIRIPKTLKINLFRSQKSTKKKS